MTERIIIGGSGGHGVLTLGLLLARTGVFEKKKVTWLPSYGAEKRGGFSFCNVIVSDEDIFSPVVENPDTLIVFDQRALNTYKSKITDSTFVICNSSLINQEQIDEIKARKVISIPATYIAKNTSFVKGMNIVVAGAYHAVKTLFKVESAITAMKNLLLGKPGQILEKNEAAFNAGLEYVKEHHLI